MTIRPGQPWGDDFAMYILHAKNIASGKAYTDTGYIPNPGYAVLGPAAYPPLFPLVLSPVYRMNTTVTRSKSLSGDRLVRVKRIPIVALEIPILSLFLKKAVANRKGFDFRPHKTTKCILWRAYDRLPSDVKTGVYEYRATCPLKERGEQCMIPRVSLFMYCLYPSRVVYMCYRRNVRARDFQLINPEP